MIYHLRKQSAFDSFIIPDTKIFSSRFFAKEKRCRNLLTPLHSLILTLRFMQTIYINANLHYSFSFISSVAFVSICLYCSFVNAPYQVPYKLKAASAALLHCFFGFLTTSGNFFDHGSRSSKNDRSLSSMRLGISVRRCSKYSYGFRLFAFAVSAML